MTTDIFLYPSLGSNSIGPHSGEGRGVWRVFQNNHRNGSLCYVFTLYRRTRRAVFSRDPKSSAYSGRLTEGRDGD